MNCKSIPSFNKKKKTANTLVTICKNTATNKQCELFAARKIPVSVCRFEALGTRIYLSGRRERATEELSLQCFQEIKCCD